MNNTGATPQGRIEIIDAIRGMAVLGILFANIRSWSGYRFIAFTDIASLPAYELDALFNHLHYWLVDGKFYAIFSMLFGAGFGIQYLKNQHNQPPFLSKYRRRLGFLLLFGLAHALLWSGDILTLYALLAFVLVLLRNTPCERLLPLALALLCCFALPHAWVVFTASQPPQPEAVAHMTYPDMSPQTISAAFGGSDWGEVFVVNLHNLYWRWLDFFPNGRISRVLGFFVLGFYLSRSGYFLTRIYDLRYLACYLGLGLAATATARLTGTNISDWSASGSDLLLKLVAVTGQVLLALAYMSLLAQVFRRSRGKALLYPLTLIGRMAFTSYLGQTLIGIAIFYGVGLGYWATMGLAQLWLLALAIYAAQVVMALTWLRRFKQGPVEWFWGCLTAGQFRSNLKG